MKNKTSKILVGMVFVLAIIAVSLMLIETNEPQEEKQYAKYISLLRTHDEFGIPIKQSPFGYFEKIDPEKTYYYMVDGETFSITGEQLEDLI